MLKKLLTLCALISLVAACTPSATATPTPTTAAPTAAPAPTQASASTSTPESPPTPLQVDLTPAQRLAMQSLASALNAPIEQIKLISTEAVAWPNGCLGVVRMGVMCTQNVVPGFRIVFEANGKSYEYHTNQDGSIVVAASQPAPNVRIAVRALDNSLQVIDTKIPIDPPNPPTTNGVMPFGGVGGGTIYALDFTNTPRVTAMEGNVTRTLDFIQNPNYGLAVFSGENPRLS